MHAFPGRRPPLVPRLTIPGATAGLATAMALLAAAVAPLGAQDPLRSARDGVEARFSDAQPVVRYTLRVDSADLSGFTVTMHLGNVGDTVRLAMAKHPEYDDRFWRYLVDLRVARDGNAAAAPVERLDSALWRIVLPRRPRGDSSGAPGRGITVTYRIRLPVRPAGPRPAWVPFLAATGGLVGGPDAFLYVVGATLAPAHVALDLPDGWGIATGLQPTGDPRTFFAPTTLSLIDGPILVGRFHDWRFAVDGVPHRVAYWAAPGAPAFDTTTFVDHLAGVVRQAVGLFGRSPYADYDFLVQDDAHGALEHANSVTLGAPAVNLAKDPDAILEEAAHEYFHTWNLMRIHPAGYGRVDWRPAPLSSGLWVSEGFTMFYADALLRRAGLPVADSTRAAHVERLLARYLENPAFSHRTAGQISRSSYAETPELLGDYQASTHLQGEVTAAVLDLMIRRATADRRSLDDVMRELMARFSGDRGFTDRDVETVTAEVCGCEMHAFFARHIRGTVPLDPDAALRAIGLRARVDEVGAVSDGAAVPDLRIWAWLPRGEEHLHLLVSRPDGAWGRAGLHTGDVILAVNGEALATQNDFRALLRRARLGDTLGVEVRRGGRTIRARVILTGYTHPVVHLEEIPAATSPERARRARWEEGW